MPEGQGIFIVIEGIDGAGTTTQGDRLTAYFQRKHAVYFTNEPSNGPVGMLIRLALARRLLGPSREHHGSVEQPHERSELDPHTMALLFAADRADHLATQIEPNLRRGKIVICDRYVLSSLAYQGLELSLDWIIELNRFFRIPDLTFYLDVPPDHASLRMRSARWAKDLYEDEARQDAVRKRYLELIEMRLPPVGPVVTIDGRSKPDEITLRMRRYVESFLATGEFHDMQREFALFRETDREESKIRSK